MSVSKEQEKVNPMDDISSQADTTGRILLTQKMPILNMLGPNHRLFVIGQYLIISVSMQISITIPMQILATAPLTLSHTLQTDSYESGQFLLEKVSTGQQTLQGRNLLFSLHQMYPCWGLYS